MKLNGFLFNVDGLDEYLTEVTEAVITDTKISMDWEEDGDPFHALMRSDDGTYYEGTFGSPRPEACCFIDATRFQAKSGEVLLWVSWRREDTGNGGFHIIHLASDWNE